MTLLATAAALPFATDEAGSSFAGDNGLVVFASDRPAPDGSRDFEIYSMTPAGERVTQLTDNTSVPSEHEAGATEDVDDLAPATSPDGRLVAFVSNRAAPDGSTDNEIYVMGLDGRDVRAVTDTPSGPPERSAEYDPAWSPDGERIAFRRGEGRKADIWVLELASGREQRLYIPPSIGQRAFEGQPAWSPDGRSLALRKGNGQGSAIWVYDFERDRPFELIDTEEVSESGPAWSPDGTMLAYVRGDDGAGAAIWVVAADGSNARRLTNEDAAAGQLVSSDRAPAWSPDGGSIVFESTRDGILAPAPAETDEHGGGEGGHGGEGEEPEPGNIELYVMNADGSGQSRLTADDDAISGPQDVAPDWQANPRPAPAGPAVLPSASGPPEVTVAPIAPRVCASRRLIRIRVSLHFHARRIARAAVFLEGNALPVDYGRRWVTAHVDLRGKPRGTYTVKVIVRLKKPVTVRRGGRRVRTSQFTSTRRFRTCEPARSQSSSTTN